MSGSVPTFFLLTAALAVPFWVLGSVVEYQLLPGLPVTGLMFVCPGLAALWLVYRERGRAGVTTLLRQAFDYRSVRDRRWYVPIVLMTPAIFAVSWVVQRLFVTPVPTPAVSSSVLLQMIGMFALFVVPAAFEEIGWGGYALPRLLGRYRSLTAALLIGAFWAAWHWMALVQVHRPLQWVMWWTLWSVAARVIMTWLYRRTHGSLWAMVLYHAISNVCWQAYPEQGSYFDPRLMGLITAAVATGLTIATWKRDGRAAVVLG